MKTTGRLNQRKPGPGPKGFAAGAILAFGLLVMLAAPLTAAFAEGDREQQEHCVILEDQFRKAIREKAGSPQADEARALGEDGIRRCRGGANGFGTRLLSEALVKLGEVPESY